MPRDTVTVPREVLERAHGHLCKIAGTECWTHNNLDGWQATPGALREYAENAAKELDEALSSSDPEGGARGETALEHYIRTRQPLFSTAWEREEYERLIGFTKSAPAKRASHNSGERDPSVMPDCPGADTKSDGPDMTMRCCGQHAEDGHHPQCDRSPSDPLTKTPSADHDDGNLRSLSAPNHQPHAVSQGWREARPSIPSDGFNCIYLYEDGHEVGCLNGPQDDPAVIARANHWVGSSPSPDAKTGGEEKLIRAAIEFLYAADGNTGLSKTRVDGQMMTAGAIADALSARFGVKR